MWKLNVSLDDDKADNDTMIAFYNAKNVLWSYYKSKYFAFITVLEKISKHIWLILSL